MTASHGDLDLRSVEQQQGDQPSSPVTLEDLFLHFTREEWEILNTDQKQLYYEVMMGVYRDVLSLGLGASSSFPGSQEGQPTEPRRDFWLDSVVTQVGIMRRQPVPTPVLRENGMCVPSMQGVSGRQPQERPLQANVCTQEAHQSIMSKALIHQLPEALQPGIQCTCKSCSKVLSLPLQHKASEVINSEMGQPSTMKNNKPQESGRPLTTGAPAGQQATHNTDTQGRHREYKVIFVDEDGCRQGRLVSVPKDHFMQHHDFHNTSECEECGKIFQSKHALMQHMKYHTGERPFMCQCCGKSFSRKATLATHKQCHTPKSFCRCEECGKLIRSCSYLVIHKRTHSGERPFKCFECGKAYISKFRLTSHKKVHSGSNFRMMDHSSMTFPTSSFNLDVPCVVQAPTIILTPADVRAALQALWAEDTLE